MRINYTTKKMTLKSSTKDHVEKKLAKMDKFFDSEADASVVFRIDSGRVTCELTIRNNSMVYRAEDSSMDIIEAFDSACDIIVRRIRRQKTKLEKRLRSAAVDDYSTEFDLPPIQDDTDEYQVIRHKQISLKPLSVQEALLQMEMLGHQFFVFCNDETNLVSVVYKRNDGNYGLIEPNL